MDAIGQRISNVRGGATTGVVQQRHNGFDRSAKLMNPCSNVLPAGPVPVHQPGVESRGHDVGVVVPPIMPTCMSPMFGSGPSPNDTP